MKGYCIACLFLLLNVGVVCWGQVPPYQHAVTKTQGTLVNNLLFDRSIEPYVDVTPHFNTDAFLCTIREEIPFFTLFTYPSLEDYYLEYYYKTFNYRQFKSFTAPKGVNKITYYLGNNLIDSVEVAKHTFFFSKKTHLLEKEIKEEQNMKSSFTRNLVDQEIYFYKYEEHEEYYSVKKFLQTGKQKRLLATFTYSKDKTRLLKTEFYQWEKGKELGYFTYNNVPVLQEVFFCYDENNDLEYAFFNGAILIDRITPSGESDYRSDKIYDYRRKIDNKDKWEKVYWLSQFNIREEDEKRISFPIINNFDSKVEIKLYENRFDTIGSSFNKLFTQKSLLWKTKNIFDFDYKEVLSYRRKRAGSYGSVEGYSIYMLLLSDEESIINIGMIRRKNGFVTNGVGNTTLVSKILISSYIDNKNEYLIKRIDSSDKRGAIEYSEEYKITIKPKKGLQELYLSKDKQEYPLIIIN